MIASIGYIDVKVTTEEIKEMQGVAKDNCNPNRKLAVMQLRFLRWIEWMQKTGLHTVYMEEDDGDLCTCGLIVLSEINRFEKETHLIELLDEDSLKNHHLTGIEKIHQMKGHQRLPRCKDEAFALIYEAAWDEGSQGFLLSAYCQECLQHLAKVPGKEARAFVRFHNKSCGNLKPGKGGL